MTGKRCSQCRRQAMNLGLCPACYEKARRTKTLHLLAPFKICKGTTLEVAVATYAHEYVFRRVADTRDIAKLLGVNPYAARRAGNRLEKLGLATVYDVEDLAMTDAGREWIETLLGWTTEATAAE